MHVSVEIPDRSSGLDAALLKQFADIQRQLLEVLKTQKSTANHDALIERLDALVDALYRQSENMPHKMRNRTFGSNF